MVQQNFITRMCMYAEKSTAPTIRARAYDRLLHNTIHAIRPTTDRVHEHVTTVIKIAQTRAQHGDHYNSKLFITNAVNLMCHRDYHDVGHIHDSEILR